MARATTTAASGAWASQLKLLAMLTSLLLLLPLLLAWERQRNVVIWKVSGIITMTPLSQLTTMMICGKCSNSI